MMDCSPNGSRFSRPTEGSVGCTRPCLRAGTPHLMNLGFITTRGLRRATSYYPSHS
jgi:hypothetical protein